MTAPTIKTSRPNSQCRRGTNILLSIWDEQPGEFFCVSSATPITKDGKPANKDWHDEFFHRDELDEVATYVEQEEAEGRNVYACLHGFTKRRRLKQYAQSPKLLWADLDTRDPRTIKDLRPTVAFETSPGRYAALWVVDKPADEGLNRRLNYAIKSDRSGWDYTQVLRVISGTTNHKYDDKPKVKVLWDDGPEYTVVQLEKALPQDHANLDAGTESDAAAVFKKYERKLPHWVRRELMSGKPQVGMRSDMLWKLGTELIERGLTRDEAFVLIKASPWNKFKGRRTEDEQLRRGLDKAINGHLKGSKPAKDERNKDEDDGPLLKFRSMDEIPRENIDWIYYPYLARGELTILEGDPGLGKSYLMQMIGLHISDGKPLLSVKKRKTVQGRVVYFDVENSSGTVMKARLEDNGLKNHKEFIQVEEPFSISNEDALDEIYEYFNQHKPVLAVFDTINTYIGGADAFKSHEVQQTLLNFKKIAKRFNCAVVVVRHLTKSSKERAIYRGQGSIAFTGMARVVMTVGTAPDEEGEGGGEIRAMAVTKINCAPYPRALTFWTEELPDTLKHQNRSKFVWGDFIDATSEEILSKGGDEAKQGRADAAEKLLKEFLSKGPRPATEVEGEAHRAGIAIRTLDRARASLGIKQYWEPGAKPRKSMLSLPGHDQQRQQ